MPALSNILPALAAVAALSCAAPSCATQNAPATSTARGAVDTSKYSPLTPSELAAVRRLLRDGGAKGELDSWQAQGRSFDFKVSTPATHPRAFQFKGACDYVLAEARSEVESESEESKSSETILGWWLCGRAVFPDLTLQNPDADVDCHYPSDFALHGTSEKFFRKALAQFTVNQFAKSRESLLMGLDWHEAEVLRRGGDRNAARESASRFFVQLARVELARSRPGWAAFWLNLAQPGSAVNKLRTALLKAKVTEPPEIEGVYAHYLQYGLVAQVSVKKASAGFTFQFQGRSFPEEDTCHVDSTVGHPVDGWRRPASNNNHFGWLGQDGQTWSLTLMSYVFEPKIKPLFQRLVSAEGSLAELLERDADLLSCCAKQLKELSAPVQFDAEGFVVGSQRPSHNTRPHSDHSFIFGPHLDDGLWYPVEKTHFFRVEPD